MKILTLHKKNISCACGCGEGLNRLDLVNRINGKYYKIHCGRVYRLHVSAMRWIKGLVNTNL